MADVRIRTNAGCIVNYCNERLFNKDDPKDLRELLRQILAHTKAILEAEADGKHD